MDENKTNETTGKNTNNTANQPGGKLLGWLTKYADEEKYPKKPTLFIVYPLALVLSIIPAFLSVYGLYSLGQYMNTLPENAFTVAIFAVVVVYVLFFLFFVSTSKFVIRYGFSETAQFLSKMFLFTIVIVALGLLVFFFCISPYFGIVTCFLFGLLIGSIIRAVNKS